MLDQRCQVDCLIDPSLKGRRWIIRNVHQTSTTSTWTLTFCSAPDTNPRSFPFDFLDWLDSFQFSLFFLICLFICLWFYVCLSMLGSGSFNTKLQMRILEERHGSIRIPVLWAIKNTILSNGLQMLGYQPYFPILSNSPTTIGEGITKTWKL